MLNLGISLSEDVLEESPVLLCLRTQAADCGLVYVIVLRNIFLEPVLNQNFVDSLNLLRDSKASITIGLLDQITRRCQLEILRREALLIVLPVCSSLGNLRKSLL